MSAGQKPKAKGDPAQRQRKSASRLYAVQALFQMEQSGQGVDAVRREFLDHRFGASTPEGDTMADGDVDLFAEIIDAAVVWQGKVDQMTDRALVRKWPLGRIDTTLRALFRAAGAELVALQTPPRVVIAEYIAVTDAFFPEGREPGFVNGVLDHMAREARPEVF